MKGRDTRGYPYTKVSARMLDDLESILMREENLSTRRKTLGVRLRSTETQPTYDLEARVEPEWQRWETRSTTTKPP